MPSLWYQQPFLIIQTNLCLITRVGISKPYADQCDLHPDWFMHNRQNRFQDYSKRWSWRLDER